MSKHLQKYMSNKTSWENLSEPHRTAWVQHVINFYPPNTITPHEAAELARDEYSEADALLPAAQQCDME